MKAGGVAHALVPPNAARRFVREASAAVAQRIFALADELASASGASVAEAARQAVDRAIVDIAEAEIEATGGEVLSRQRRRRALRRRPADRHSVDDVAVRFATRLRAVRARLIEIPSKLARDAVDDATAAKVIAEEIDAALAALAGDDISVEELRRAGAKPSDDVLE